MEFWISITIGAFVGVLGGLISREGSYSGGIVA
jgi:hypothetical protein